MTSPRTLPSKTGYTLIEVIVVLILLTIAASVIAPALLPSFSEQSSSLGYAIGNAREAAVRRGELVRLRIDRSGAWQAVAGNSPHTELLTSGRLSDARGAADLIFSPLGTCAPTPETLPGPVLAALEPLTCEMWPR